MLSNSLPERIASLRSHRVLVYRCDISKLLRLVRVIHQFVRSTNPHFLGVIVLNHLRSAVDWSLLEWMDWLMMAPIQHEAGK